MRLSPTFILLVTALLGCDDAVTSADARAPSDLGVDIPIHAPDAAPDVADVVDASNCADLAAQAAANARAAQPVARHIRAWLADEQTHIDPQSGLLVDTFDTTTPWSTRDTAADIYPFYTWSAYFFAPEVFEATAARMLRFEREHTVSAATGAIPYSYDTRTRMRLDRGFDDLFFGSAEYVKDGLTPIFEAVGRGEWSSRAADIERDAFELGRWNTLDGTLPLDNLEVNGDHMQSLTRLYAMTRDARYLAWAERVAEHYFGHGAYQPQNLRDHSCEIIGGFALLYAIERQEGRPQAARYAPWLRAMIDYIATYGLTPEGMMHNVVHASVAGPVAAPRGALSDNWGQNYVAFLIYARATGEARYAEMVDRALRSLADPQFHDYPWEGDNIDGLADAMEGATYMLAYRPIIEGQHWLDAEAPLLDARAWPPNKFGANAARTAWLYVRTKTRGTWVQPWRDDIAWGAAESGCGLTVSVRAARAWTGVLRFDTPRYRDTLGFVEDIPRMNYLPAYFTVSPSSRYRVTQGTRVETRTGAELAAGISVTLVANEEAVVTVAPAP